MFWSCCSINGGGEMHVFEGNCNADLYIKILDNELIKSIRKWKMVRTYIF